MVIGKRIVAADKSLHSSGMNSNPHSLLVRYKRWADQGLYDVITSNIGQLGDEDISNLIRVLDHIHVVDQIFRRHLEGRPNSYGAPRSKRLPELPTLKLNAAALDEWYVDYAANLHSSNVDTPLDITFTSGRAARMTRADIILHVCLHGTYHRGNAGIILQKAGIAPNDDRMIDFLEQTIR
jgi:uncharacterized damage-inducible protein DinB